MSIRRLTQGLGRVCLRSLTLGRVLVSSLNIEAVDDPLPLINGKQTMERAWLLEELKPHPAARNALGVIVDRPKSNPESPLGYELLYREKVLRAIQKSLEYGEDLLDVVDALLLARLDPKENLLAQLKEVDGWMSPMYAMLRYLRKEGSLDEVKEALWGNNPESPYPVSEKEALAEQENLTLSELLESVMTS